MVAVLILLMSLAPIATRAARSAIHRPPQEGQIPRPLQLNGTGRSKAQSPQRTRAKPCACTPQRRNLTIGTINLGR